MKNNKNIFKQEHSFENRKEESSLIISKNVGKYPVIVQKHPYEDSIIEIEEKPENPKSNFACVGIYFYSNKVFDIIKNVKKSDRGEYEITSINNEFIKSNSCEYSVLEKRWVDAGTLSAYHSTNTIIYVESQERK